MTQAIPTTWLDRALEKWAPDWQLRREASRAALASYRGGLGTRLSDTWGTQTTYRFSEVGDRQLVSNMRDRAWKVDRDNPLGRTILNTEVDNIVANGLTLQANTASEAFNDEAEARFAEFLDQADLYGRLSGSELQRLFYRSCRRDGDGGLVLTELNGKLKLQHVPARLIRNPIGKYSERIIDGVEVDALGRTVRIHVETTGEDGIPKTTGVPARDFVYFAPNVTDASQVRPPTCFDTVFNHLDSLDGYVDGVVTAARMATVFGLIFKKAAPERAYNALANTLTDSRGEQRRAVTLENGMVKYVGERDEVAQVNATQPMTQTPDFIRAMVRMIGQPFDMPLEIIAKDMSTVNFSSARVGLLGYYRACRARQKAYGYHLGQIYRWWVSKTVARGEFEAAVPDLYWPHEFVPQGWDYTDPISEVQSDMMQVEAGLKTLQMCAIERGRDFTKMQVKQSEANRWRQENGLTDVRTNMTRDVTPAPAPGDEELDPPVPPEKQDDDDADEEQDMV